MTKDFRSTLAILLLCSLKALPGMAAETTVPEVRLVPQHGVYMIPIRINDSPTLHAIVDTGASEVQIPGNIAVQLLHSGDLRETDFLPNGVYTMADGSRVQSERVLIRRFQIGDQVVQNVPASIGNNRSAFLIGQSLLSRFPTWSLDNRRQVLILGKAAGQISAGTPPPDPRTGRGAGTQLPPPATSHPLPPQEPSLPPPSNPINPPSRPIISSAPERPATARGPDTRDKKLLRILCDETDARKMLDCSDTP